MRPINEIVNNINNIKEKQSLIKLELEKKKAVLQEAKKRHNKLVVSEVGKERKSQSLNTQQREIQNLSTEIESLEGANQDLEKELEKLNSELEHARAFEQFERFKEDEIVFFDRIGKAKKALTEFSRLAGSSLTIPLESIWSLLNKLRSEVLLEDFFEKMIIQEADAEKNQAWLDNLGSRYKRLIEDLPPAIDLNHFRAQLRNGFAVAEAVSKGARGLSGSKVEISDKPVQADPGLYVRKNPERYSQADVQKYSREIRQSAF